ncbi:MAG: hypothetical protein QXJ06_02660 [Candidatus Aenigmatarchaeota archaeon]
MAKQKKETDKVEQQEKKETPDDLKKKVDSLVDIIEELSSNVDKSGIPEVENLIDTKLKEINEKFELKFQDLKNVLDSIEKKSGRVKTKEEISALIEEFKKSIEPRFATLEDRLKLLDRLETLGETPQQEEKQSQQSQKVDFSNKNNYEIEMIKRNISEINQILSSLKEQIDTIRSGVRAQGLLDSNDVQKLENILTSLNEMIPQKNVIENFRLTFREINDLKNKINEFRGDLQKYIEKQKENYEDISSRIETLVKYLNAIIEERDRNFNELSKISTDTFTKTVNIEKSLEYFSKNLKDLNVQINKQNERIKILDEINKRFTHTSTKDDLRIINENMKKILEQHKKEMEDISKIVSSMYKSLDQKLLEEAKTNRDRFDKLQKILDDGLRKNNELIKTMIEEKKGIEKTLEMRKQKIIDILKELRK